MAQLPPFMPQMQLPQAGQFAQPDMTPAPSQGGMFGGGKFGIGQAIAFGLAGLTARRNPMLLQGLLGMMSQQRENQLLAQRQQAQNDAELQRQIALKKWTMENDPTAGMDDFGKTLMEAGIMPGTPEWTKAMQTRKDNLLDPLTMIPGGGMAPASVARAMISANAPTAPVGKLTPIDGGPTPSASGGFPGY